MNGLFLTEELILPLEQPCLWPRGHNQVIKPARILEYYRRVTIQLSKLFK